MFEKKIFKKSKGKLSPKILKGLVKRWAFFNKSYSVANMKKELKWIPIIYLVHKTVDMPFLNRHTQAQVKSNPELKKLDYENAKKAALEYSEIFPDRFYLEYKTMIL